ncbi:MAG: hypothetical protein CM1200mP26_26700 [Acidimicrobiales bacterium]|nr:MAG: hypothetical protein CM1200mP26_26700 [Acidimicrobiales bacterium]
MDVQSSRRGFGLDAHRFVNSEAGRAVNLRGINAGGVGVGDDSPGRSNHRGAAHLLISAHAYRDRHRSPGGIGAATASDLARWGWRVFGFDLRAGESNLVSSDLAGFGGSIEPIRVDVTDRAAVEAAVAAVLAATGGTLDAVVANAGVRVAGAFEETPFAEVRRLFEVNLGGVMHVTRAALPALRATEGSRVVVVSSVGGLSALPGLAAYCGSKWAVEGWAESLAHELQPLGVGVALVEPASVRTGLWDLGTVPR